MPVGERRERGAGTVFVVDDDASMCEALSSLLRAVGWQVQTFATAGSFLDYRRSETPSCLVLDVRLPGVSGLELQRTLAERGDELPIIFMSSHGDIPMTVRAIKAGAVEFLPKPFRESDLLAAIDEALASNTVALHDRAEVDGLRQRLDSLSSREREVMSLVVSGMLNKQAAAALGISEETIKVHRRRVMDKMGAQSLADLVRLVERVQPSTG
jgi:FixJ family two-component response regulator